MKRYIYILSAALLLLSSCSIKPTNPEKEAMIEEHQVTIKATFEEIEDLTKTTYTEETGTMKAIVDWSAGDKISILFKDGGYKKKEFTTISGDGVFSGVASGTEGGDYAYWAIYPYNICDDLYPSGNKESTRIVLPSEYTGDGTDGIPMSVHTLRDDFDGTYRFKHMGSVIRFKIVNIPSNARHFVISNSSYDLAGRYFTTYDSTNDLIYYTSGTSEDGNQRSVTYHFTPNEDGSYTFYLPFGVATPSDNFTFTFKDEDLDDICTRTTTLGALASTSLQRNTMYRVNIDALSFTGYPGLSKVTIIPSNLSGTHNGTAPGNLFTVGGFNFYALNARKPSSKNWIEYNNSGNGSVYNASDFGRIVSITVNKTEEDSFNYYRSLFTVYAGTEMNPSTTTIDYSSFENDDSSHNLSTTYVFTKGDYHYFKLMSTDTQYYQYTGTIEITYLPKSE